MIVLQGLTMCGFPLGVAADGPLVEIATRAQPDEFYNGLGVSPYIPFGEQLPEDVGQPKINYDYLWGMAADENAVWFSVSANVVSYLYAFAGAPAAEFKSRGGIPYRAWELRKSQYPVLPDILKLILGDWRPPRIFRWDLRTQTLKELTPDHPLLTETLGIRSAVIVNGTVLFGGPSLLGNGVSFFAFDQATGEFLNAQSLQGYSNIRRWVVHNGVAYAGVLNSSPDPGFGSVVRWTGDRLSPAAFDVVGDLDNEAAYLAIHRGRLYAGTWPSIPVRYQLAHPEVSVPTASIWESPLIPREGLSARDAKRWSVVWRPDEYEPDPVIVNAYALGAMESFGGDLYWGTINPPLAGFSVLKSAYNLKSTVATIRDSDRRCTLFRSRMSGGRRRSRVELLLGDAQLAVYEERDGTGTWTKKPNRTSGRQGLFGPAGFTSKSNYYVWSGEVHRGSLYFGTFDSSTFDSIGRILDGASEPQAGGDLWRIDPTGSATILSTNGLGNPANHGFRNLESTPYGLFLGTANSQNLLGDLYDDLPDGGWELIRLAP